MSGERRWTNIHDEVTRIQLSRLFNTNNLLEYFGYGIPSEHQHNDTYRYLADPEDGFIQMIDTVPAYSYHSGKIFLSIENDTLFYIASDEGINPLYYQHTIPLSSTVTADSFIINFPDDDLGRLGGNHIRKSNGDFIYSVGTLDYPEIEEAARIRKVDKFGNTIWTTELDNHDWSGGIGDVIEYPSGNLATSWVTDEGLDFFDATYPPVIIYFDAEGNEKWRTVLRGTGGGTNKAVSSLHAASNGDIIGVGSDLDHFEHPDSLYLRGWVFRLSGSGQLLWSKTFEHPFDLNHFQFLSDVTELENGDLAVVGLDSKIRNPGQPNQSTDGDVWLMRLTSDGKCPGCDIISWDSEILTDTEDLPTLPSTKGWVLANPVPANATITLKQANADQLTDSYDLRLFNSGGTPLRYYPGIRFPQTIDVAQLPGGQYYFQFIDPASRRPVVVPFSKL